MTTSEEPGPELDRRVSEAMGKGPVMVLDCYPEHLCFAPYSTDPARIAEMVEWLRAIGDYSDINIDLTAQSGVMARMGFWPDGDVEREWVDAAVDKADSIQHALALLVVAVGEVGSDT